MTRVIASAASGELRDNHYVLNPVTGLYERSTLLEKASTNLCLQSENFGTTWAASGSPTRVAAAHTASGVTLDLIGDDSGAAVEYYTQTITLTGNGVKALSVFVKAGTIQAAGGAWIDWVDNTAVAERLDCGLTFSAAGVPSASMSTGTFLGYEVLADGVYRLYFRTTSVTAANTNVLGIGGARTVAEQGNFYVGGVQAENSLYPTSYKATTTGTVTRNADNLSVPFTPVPQNSTVYFKFVERGTILETSARILDIGDSASSASRLLLFNAGSNYTFRHTNASASVDSAAAATPAWGDLVELRGVLGSDGSVTLGQSINGAAEVVAATSAANALAATWSDDVIWLGSVNGTAGGAVALYGVKYANGTKTMAEMRALADMASSVLVLNAGDPNAITLRVQSAQKAEATDIGGRERAFAGNLRVSTREQKDQWNVTTVFVDASERDAINTLIANNAPRPCAGVLFGNETVSCSIKATGEQMSSGSNLWTLGLTLTEV